MKLQLIKTHYHEEIEVDLFGKAFFIEKVSFYNNKSITLKENSNEFYNQIGIAGFGFDLRLTY